MAISFTEQTGTANPWDWHRCGAISRPNICGY